MARIDKSHGASHINTQRTKEPEPQKSKIGLFVPPAKAPSLKGRVQAHVHQDPRITKLSEKI